MTGKRNKRNSDKANRNVLTTKVNDIDLALINDVRPPTMCMSEWVRLACISAAFHERNRIMLEAVAHQ